MSLSQVCHRPAKLFLKTTVNSAVATTLWTVCALAIATPPPASAKPASSQITSSAFPVNPTVIQQKRNLAQAVHSTKGTVSAGELSITGLDFYATEADVLAVLGPPKSRDVLPDSFIDEVLYFGGISIAMAGDQVWDIIATSPKFCIPSGVCPGDSVDYAFSILGPTEIVGQEATYTSPTMGSCSINLGISGDIISQIKIACP